ncbi:MAG TPA: GYD domain-containing protein [Actinomycetota bacterium]|nr:GYD domain-containing protein [Actinomycetota bacterium]
MPKYLLKAAYGPDGVSGVMKEGGTGRRDAVEKLVANLGGSLESFHFAFGDVDAYVIVDLPDNKTAAAVALTVNANTAVGVETIVLMTPEEVDEATKTSVDYRAPGA